jgi:hypothetical protein
VRIVEAQRALDASGMDAAFVKLYANGAAHIFVTR